MIFNGLSGSDLVVFNALDEILQEEEKQVSSTHLSMITGYHVNTVRLALRRLEDCRLIARRQPDTGSPYLIKILDRNGYALSHS